MDKMSLVRRLETLLTKTEAAEQLDAAGWWDGDDAGKRKVLDDLKAGRLSWQAAHRHAESGLRALTEGKLDLAETYLWESNDQYIIAIEAQLKRLRPSDRGALDRSAKRRGRPPKN